MIYPEFLKENSTVGICAPSAGVGHKLESFDLSLSALKKQGWKFVETEHVRILNLRGGSAKERAQELMSLSADPKIDAIFSASGGDFLLEMLPYVDWKKLAENPKWIMGASDPTGLLFPLTTMCDVATLYGSNAGSFDTIMKEDGDMPAYLKGTLGLLKGEFPVQETFPMHLGVDPFLADDGPVTFDLPTVYRANTGELHTHGRCIGGCIDVLKDLIGTKFDAAAGFVEKYAGDGIIWYFDNFAFSSAALYRTFLQMRSAGWITPETTRAVIIGRTLFEREESEMTYEDAVEMAFPDIPAIWEADVGHTIPHFAMVNGAMLDLDWDGSKTTLKFRFE